MKIQIVGLLALGLLVTAQPGAFAQTSTSPSTTTQPSNPRSNPDNDQSGPRSTEPRTDATPNASTSNAERMEKGTMMDKGNRSTMSKPKTDKSGDSMNKPRSSSTQGGSMSKSNADITNTTNLPESKSRPDDALLVDPPSGYSNNDPNLKPRTDTQNPTTTRPK